MVARKILAALVVLMLAVSSFAQDANRVYFGARLGGGIGLSRPAGDDAKDWKDEIKEDDGRYWSGGSFDFAPFAAIQLTDVFALQTEFLFTRFGYGQKWKEYGEKYGENTSRAAMVIPVLAKFTLLDRKLSVFAGPHLMPGIGKYKESWIEDGNKKNEKEDAKEYNDYEKSQLFGLTFGADYGFTVGTGRLFFDARYLTSLGAPREGDKVKDWEKPKTYMRLAKLAFSVGYEFGAVSR